MAHAADYVFYPAMESEWELDMDIHSHAHAITAYDAWNHIHMKDIRDREMVRVARYLDD